MESHNFLYKSGEVGKFVVISIWLGYQVALSKDLDQFLTDFLLHFGIMWKNVQSRKGRMAVICDSHANNSSGIHASWSHLIRYVRKLGERTMRQRWSAGVRHSSMFTHSGMLILH